MIYIINCKYFASTIFRAINFYLNFYYIILLLGRVSCIDLQNMTSYTFAAPVRPGNRMLFVSTPPPKTAAADPDPDSSASDNTVAIIGGVVAVVIVLIIAATTTLAIIVIAALVLRNRKVSPNQK